ncbi:MAG: hypothetical protein AB7S48_06330 [Bacteroidales bacterium]
MEQYEMVVHSSEHISLLTKVLMMFTRRRIEVIRVVSETDWNTSLYVITFKSRKEEAFKLQQQVQKATDILDATLNKVDYIRAKYSNRYQSHQFVTK